MSRFAVTVLDVERGVAIYATVNLEDLLRLGAEGGQQPITDPEARPVRVFVGPVHEAQAMLRDTGWRVTFAEDRKDAKRPTALEAIRHLEWTGGGKGCKRKRD